MFAVSFGNRHDSGPRLVADGSALRVRRLAWSAVGGAESAEIEVVGGAAGFDLLGCPVWVTAAAGEPVWWGYVSAVVARGMPGLSVSLDGLANRVAVAYPYNGELLFTPWADDRASQLEYGIHEGVARTGTAAREEAERLRDAVLAQSGRPRVDAGEAGAGAVLRCRGWWHALEWRAAAQFASGARYEHGASGWAAVGSSAETAQVGQSFRVVEMAQRLTAVAVRLRKTGSPADSLRVQVCLDAGGEPGAALGQALIPAADVTAGAAWVTAAFTPAIDLSAGAPYWLVLSRVGSASATAYYLLEKDTAGGYADGALRVHGPAGWGAVTGEALLFRAESLPEAAALLRRWLEACAPMLAGARFEGGLVARAGGYPGEALTVRAAVERLLRAGQDGRRLLAEITPARFARVTPMPKPSARDWMPGPGGALLDASGQPLPPYRPAPGRWLRIGQSILPQPRHAFIERCEFDPASGRMKWETG